MLFRSRNGPLADAFLGRGAGGKDGKEFGSWDITAAEMKEYHQPFYPILNVAVGSWTHSYTGLDTPEKITAELPARMYVDWIRLDGHPNTKVDLRNKQR